MSKTPITWLELIKLKLSEEKAKGKSPSIGDVTPLAKKEWVQIKEGKHPKYMQGKAKSYARKKTTNNKTKKNKRNNDDDDDEDNDEPSTKTIKSTKRHKSNKSIGTNSSSKINELLSDCKLCAKCKKNINKYMKKNNNMSGGCGTCGVMGGGCGCSGAGTTGPAPV